MIQKPSDQLLESLSALVDNEASELEVRRILKNVEQNPEVRERWRRYNLIGSVLRSERDLNASGNVNVAESVALALADEQSLFNVESLSDESTGRSQPAVVTTSARKGLLDFAAKSAVAASFAAALVFGFNSLTPQKNDDFESGQSQLAGLSSESESLNSSVNVSAAPLGFELPAIESRTVSATSGSLGMRATRPSSGAVVRSDDLTDVETQNLLNDLLIHHAERASVNGSLGIMPFARVSQMQPSEAAK